ncbi:MAG: CHAT domain-containing protein [bacterium]|nr:CHAT domain-containing protein [bacterium]
MFQPDPNNPGFGENFRIELASQINLARTWNQMGDPHQALISCTAATEAGQGRIPFDLSIELETQRGCNQVAVGQVKQGEASFIKALTLLHETGSLAPIGQGRIFSKDARHELLEEMIGLYADHPQLLPAGSLGLRTILLAEQGRWSADHKTRIEDLDSLEPLIEKVKGPLLVFFLGKDRSFSWLVNDGQIKLHEIAGRDEIIKNMRIFLAGATHAEEPINTLASQWLSVNLLGSAMRAWPNGETLNIVPDGVLFSTPWAALPLPDQTESTLVLDYGSIIQNPSVRTFVGHSQSRRDSPKPGSGALVSIGVDGISVGNDLDNNLPPLPDLRHAETEARAIADLWPEPNTALLLGKNATWEKINGLDLSGFQAIHLATHSVIKQGLPGRSTLRLADGKNGEPLTVHHITDLDLQADLVFLSSCSSARMLSGTGGIVNFARAFLTSGAGAVIGPTIRINDEAAHQLATRFYKNWLAGENKADALRGAQISLRSDARWSHPYYWGFYRIIGDGR